MGAEGIWHVREDSQHSGFAVTVDEKTTSIDVRDKSAKGPTVFIPKQKKMNGIELFETHWS